MSIRCSPQKPFPSAIHRTRLTRTPMVVAADTPAFLHAATAKIRILPPEHCKPWRRARRMGPAIKLAEPTASVQIPIAHRFR
jgi:hypothetical protein